MASEVMTRKVALKAGVTNVENDLLTAASGQNFIRYLIYRFCETGWR